LTAAWILPFECACRCEAAIVAPHDVDRMPLQLRIGQGAFFVEDVMPYRQHSLGRGVVLWNDVAGALLVNVADASSAQRENRLRLAPCLAQVAGDGPMDRSKDIRACD